MGDLIVAKLHNKEYPGNWEKSHYETHDDYYSRVRKMYEELPWENILRFSVADGYAYYFIKSRKPLVLQHIPIADAYRIDPAHIRGLRLIDVELKLEFHKTIDNLFERKS